MFTYKAENVQDSVQFYLHGIRGQIKLFPGYWLPTEFIHLKKPNTMLDCKMV